MLQWPVPTTWFARTIPKTFSKNYWKTERIGQNYLHNVQLRTKFPFFSSELELYADYWQAHARSNNSFSLIVNIFPNNVQDEVVSGNVISDISYHYTQFCITHSIIEHGRTKWVLIRDYSNFWDENFLNDLSSVDWLGVVPENERNVDKLFSKFYRKLNKLINKHAPLKPASKRKVKMFCKPWITGRIRKSIMIKNKLLSMYKCHRNKILMLTNCHIIGNLRKGFIAGSEAEKV